MKLSEKPASFDPHSECVDSPNEPSPAFTQLGLTIQDMASRISDLRRPYPHVSLNPLTGNSLY